jgi:hypothetical protein
MNLAVLAPNIEENNMPNPTNPDANLDVAFSSNTTANNPSLPIAMAYGYTDNLQGGFQGKGQTEETVAPGSTVYFEIFDTASNPTFNIVSATISAVNKHPGAGKANSPFSDTVWSTGTVVATSSPNGGNEVQLSTRRNQATSTGCNVIGTGWGIGPFTVGNFNGQRFEITITVVMRDNASNQKTFTVDPEMVVGEGK